MKLRTIIKRYSEELIIYGAGACGSEVWEWIKDDISSFRFIVYAVSGRVPEKKYKHGLEVKCICDLKKYAESAVVIVAVTERYKKEIIKNLNALEFRNVVTLE